MIELKNVTKTYRAKKGRPYEALKGISLTLPSRGAVFLLGRSGSGKTTLLNIIGLLDTPTGGTVEVFGATLREKEIDDYRNRFSGFVFQDFALLEEETVGRNVALALQLQSVKNVDEKVAQALEKVGLKGYETRYPFELSGGEKQRVAIARAIVKDSEMILADEPTGNLDSETGEEIFELLKALSKEKLVVIVTHDREFAERYADRIIELKDGLVVSDSAETEEEEQRGERGVKSHLQALLAFRMGWRNFGRKKFKSAMTFLVAMLSMAVLVFAQTLVSFNAERAVSKSVVQNDIASIKLLQRDSSDDFGSHIGGSDTFRDEDFRDAIDHIPYLEQYDDMTGFSDVTVIENRRQLEELGYSLYDGAMELSDDTVYLADTTLNQMFRDTYDALQPYSSRTLTHFVREGEELVPLSEETYGYASIVGKTIVEKGRSISEKAVYNDLYTVAGVVDTGSEPYCGKVDERFDFYNWEQYLERFGGTKDAYQNEELFKMRFGYLGKFIVSGVFATREFANRNVENCYFSNKENDPHTVMLSDRLYCDGASLCRTSSFGIREQILFEGMDVLPDPSAVTLKKGEVIIDERSYNRLFPDDALRIATTIDGDDRVIRQPKRLGSTVHLLIKRGNRILLDGNFKIADVRMHLLDEQPQKPEDKVSAVLYCNDEDLQSVAAVSLRPYKVVLYTGNVGEMRLYRTLRALRYDHAIAAEFETYTHFIYSAEPYQKNIGFAFLAVGAGMFLITMLIVISLISYNILAQRKEIGTLRALGARAGDVAKIYFAQAFILAAVTMILSMAITLTLLAVLNSIFATAEELIGLVMFGYTPLTFPVLLFGTFGAIFAGTAAPLGKISRYDPADAIKKG